MDGARWWRQADRYSALGLIPSTLRKSLLSILHVPTPFTPLEHRFSLVTKRVRIVWGTIFSHANIQITEMIIFFYHPEF